MLRVCPAAKSCQSRSKHLEVACYAYTGNHSCEYRLLVGSTGLQVLEAYQQ